MNIKDIAKIAGVSTATVSRVVNNKQGVKDDVRNHVKKIMEKYDYTPNLVARGLVTSKTNVIGVFVPRFVDYYSPRLDAIMEYCNKENYAVMLAGSVGKFEGNVKSLNTLYEKQVEGIVYFVGKFDDENINLIKKISSKIPFVLVDQTIKNVEIPHILPDNYEGTRKILEYMYECGHRKIAFIGSPVYDIEGENRFKAYIDFMKEKDITPDKSYYRYSGKYSIKSGYFTAKLILEENIRNRPTAILATNDFMAIGAINYIKDIGLSVPKDISVAGIDDVPIASYYNPRLTTVKQDQYKIGKEAVKLVFDMIKGDKVKIKKIIMEQELIVRESVKMI